MCMLLAKASPLNLPKILDFYYRRIKRIVPLYLCVIAVILLLGLFFVAPTEFHHLGTDAWTSAIFCSNFLNLDKGGYFNLVSSFFSANAPNPIG